MKPRIRFLTALFTLLAFALAVGEELPSIAGSTAADAAAVHAVPQLDNGGPDGLPALLTDDEHDCPGPPVPPEQDCAPTSVPDPEPGLAAAVFDGFVASAPLPADAVQRLHTERLLRPPRA